jgi:hypothetical protein
MKNNRQTPKNAPIVRNPHVSMDWPTSKKCMVKLHRYRRSKGSCRTMVRKRQPHTDRTCLLCHHIAMKVWLLTCACTSQSCEWLSAAGEPQMANGVENDHLRLPSSEVNNMSWPFHSRYRHLQWTALSTAILAVEES